MASCAPFWRGCSWRSTEGAPTWPVTAGARGPSRGPGANEIAGPHPASYIEGSDTYDNGVIPMVRKVGLLLCCAVLLGSESVYFARLTAAGIFRLRGERAFFRNAHERSWDSYRRALALGGDRDRLETDQAELLLFGLDQGAMGARVRPALPQEEAVRAASQLVASRITETPYRAHHWSLASDVYFHAARLRRHETPLDLSSLTDNPLDILLPEERLGLAALETASRLEPSNYIYHDLLVEKFLDLRSVSR